MAKLVKTEILAPEFNNAYIGERVTEKGNLRKVCCILDDNCVRYIVLENGKRVRTSEFSNDKKAKCFANAEKALNR